MSHFEGRKIPVDYNSYIQKKLYFLIILFLLLFLVLVAGITLGAVNISPPEIIKTFLNLNPSARISTIIYSIRLPRAVAAIFAGAGLAVAGAVMQSVLRNPLGSPFTLGISQAAAFGAAFAVMILGAGEMQSSQVGSISVINPYLTVVFAFGASVIAALVIIIVARLRGATPEVMVLSGVALGSLFSAGTLFLQYFADDTQLAAMVFWTFGDVGRAGWSEVSVIFPVVTLGSAFFIYMVAYGVLGSFVFK
ncbi:MAG: FecCD family ABC transporter permease, partial [bacterium]